MSWGNGSVVKSTAVLQETQVQVSALDCLQPQLWSEPSAWPTGPSRAINPGQPDHREPSTLANRTTESHQPGQPDHRDKQVCDHMNTQLNLIRN